MALMGEQGTKKPVESMRAARVISPGRPRLRTTFQLRADVQPVAATGQSVDAVYAAVVGTALEWLAEKYPEKLPKAAWDLQGFELKLPGQSLDCVSLSDSPATLWSARLEQIDVPFAGRPAAPGRVWTTDIAVTPVAAAISVALRVQCASLVSDAAPPALTRPRLVVDWAKRFCVLDGRIIDGKPWKLKAEDELDALYQLLLNPQRTLPVYVLTQPDRKRLGLNVGDYLLDADELAKAVQGCAIVALLPKDLGYKWTEKVGKEWSVFLGAVRTYQAGLNFETDSPQAHPLALAERILRFEYNGLKMERAFAVFLKDQAFVDAASKRISIEPCRFYLDALRLKAERTRAETEERTEWEALYEDQIKTLERKIEELEEISQAFSDDAARAVQDRNLYTEENRDLRGRVHALQLLLEAKTGESIDATTPIPDNYGELEEWARRYLVARLVLHPRALRGAQSAVYQDVGRVYQALLALGRDYRDMRLGLDGARSRWEDALKRLELRVGGSIAKERAGEQGDTYFVKFPIHSQQSRLLDLHLRKGSTKDDRHCLGIYFFWDEETQQVVVGWLPSHLTTRAT